MSELRVVDNRGKDWADRPEQATQPAEPSQTEAPVDPSATVQMSPEEKEAIAKATEAFRAAAAQLANKLIDEVQMKMRIYGVTLPPQMMKYNAMLCSTFADVLVNLHSEVTHSAQLAVATVAADLEARIAAALGRGLPAAEAKCSTCGGDDRDGSYCVCPPKEEIPGVEPQGVVPGQ